MPQLPTPLLTRNSIIDNMAELVTIDFGEAPDHPYQPFCPHCVAHQAVAMLQAAYEDFDDADAIADRVLETNGRTS